MAIKNYMIKRPTFNTRLNSLCRALFENQYNQIDNHLLLSLKILNYGGIMIKDVLAWLKYVAALRFRSVFFLNGCIPHLTSEVMTRTFNISIN